MKNKTTGIRKAQVLSACVRAFVSAGEKRSEAVVQYVTKLRTRTQMGEFEGLIDSMKHRIPDNGLREKLLKAA